MDSDFAILKKEFGSQNFTKYMLKHYNRADKPNVADEWPDPINKEF